MTPIERSLVIHARRRLADAILSLRSVAKTTGERAAENAVSHAEHALSWAKSIEVPEKRAEVVS